MAGRPTDYTEELGIDICALIAEGKALATICKSENMPSIRTVYYWLKQKPEFLQLYTRAKEDSADALTDESLEIADNIVGNPVLIDGVPMQLDGKVLTVVDAASINHARLRIETRKWYASKLKPKKYGDKIDHEVTGSVTLVLSNNDERI